MKRKTIHRNRARRAAFTLLEVMLVLVILAAIAGIAVVNIGGFQESANKKIAKTTINAMKSALETYRLEIGSYPQQLNDLHEQPSDLADPSKWYQFYKEPIAADPWSNEYEYTVNGADFEIRCLGPDGKSGTEDDIVS